MLHVFRWQARCLINFGLTALLGVCVPTHAEIADKKLQRCVADHAKKHGWNSPAEFATLTCHNKGIETLLGLDAYVNLNKLSLHKNKIKAFDITPFPRLKHLNLARNQLSDLSIGPHTALEKLYLFNSGLQSLQLNSLDSLQMLKANSNQIVDFDYQNLPALKKLYLFDNEMETIDIDNLPSMQYMDVRQNPMPDELYEEMDRRNGVTILHDGNADDWN